MVPEVLYRVCYGNTRPSPLQVSHLTFQPAVLPGYIRRKVRGFDYPGITPAAAPASVRGTYVYGLTDGDMWRLGIFEGSQYERRTVRVRLLTDDVVVLGSRAAKGEEESNLLAQKDLESGQELDADTYVFMAGDAWLEEGEWDFEVFKRDKLKRWVGENDDDEEDEEDEFEGE